MIKKIIFYLLIVLNIGIVFLPPFGVLDMKHIQYFYLSIVQILSVIFLCFNNFKSINFSILSFIFFNFWCFISVFYSEYNLISLDEFRVYFTLLFTLINLTILIDKKTLFYFVPFLIVGIQTVEVFIIFKNFILNFDYYNPTGRSDIYMGLSTNLNITAFSILFKIPLILYLSYKFRKRKIFSIYFLILNLISTFILYLISSRGAMLCLIAVGVLYGISFIWYQYKHKIRKDLILILFALLATISIAYISHNLLYENSANFKVVDRVTNFQDNSTNQRIGFYKNSFEHFLKSPILGWGVGTWKIYSIDYHRPEMIDYQVPYHTHNDYLQILAEVGLIGLIFYIFFIYYPGLKILISLIKERDPEKFILYTTLLSCFLIYFFDSNINFPRLRGISQLNLLLLIVATNLLIEDKIKIKLNKKKYILTSFIFLSILIFYNFKLYESSKEHVVPYVEYNFSKELKMPLEKVLSMDDIIMPVNSVTVPIKNTKAFYLIENEKYDKALTLAREGKKENPYLYMSEYQFASIFLKQKLIDSALFYAKIAFDSIKLNAAHATKYQQVLFALEDKMDFKELERIYNYYEKNNIKNEVIVENHIKGILIKGDYRNFNERDKEIVLKAEKDFPLNNSIPFYKRIIFEGIDKFELSNNFSKKAEDFFKDEKFIEAIEIWEKAIEINPFEEAYYLNIAQAYTSLNETSKSIEYLNKIINKNIVGNNGKFEFILGLNYIELKDFPKACTNLNKSSKKGYKLSNSIMKQIKCL